MKQITRKLFDEMIRLERKWKKTGDTDIYKLIIETATNMSMQAFDDDIHWPSLCDLFKTMCGNLPLKECAKAEMEYILSLFGIKIVDDDETLEKNDNDGDSNDEL